LQLLCAQLQLASAHPMAPQPVRIALVMLAQVLTEQQQRIEQMEAADLAAAAKRRQVAEVLQRHVDDMRAKFGEPNGPAGALLLELLPLMKSEAAEALAPGCAGCAG
jgi:hypothetical protein